MGYKLVKEQYTITNYKFNNIFLSRQKYILGQILQIFRTPYKSFNTIQTIFLKHLKDKLTYLLNNTFSIFYIKLIKSLYGYKYK